MKRKGKRILAGTLALLIGCASLFNSGLVAKGAEVPAARRETATETTTMEIEASATGTAGADFVSEPVPDLSQVANQLAEDEIVTVEDYTIAAGTQFDPEVEFSGMRFDEEKVRIHLHEILGESGQAFDFNVADTYQAVYYAEPTSGNPIYRITRKIIVQEETVGNDQGKSGQEGTKESNAEEEEDADPDPEPDLSPHPTSPESTTSSTINKEEQLLEVPEMSAAVEDTVDITSDDHGVLFSAVKSTSANATRATNVPANMTKGEQIPYPAGLGNYSTGYYEVNGKVAYCLESAKASPPESSYVAQELENNPNLQKVLYYGYGGPGDITGSFMPTFDWQLKYIFTHLAASYFYSGMDGFNGCTLEDIEACGVLGFIEYIYAQEEPPTAAISLSPTNVVAYESGDRQRTEKFKLTGDHRNYISLSLPANITYHSGSGSISSGTIKIYGGTSFYFSAPKTVSGTWKSDTLQGQLGSQWKALVLSTGDTTQDIGYGTYFEEEASSVSFAVKWMELAKIKIVKADSSNNVTLAGAVFGVYSDKSCTSLITKMPPTDSNGVTEVEITKTQDTVYVKEITAPTGYVINTSGYDIDIEVGKTTTKTVKNKEIKGELLVKKIDVDTDAFISQGDASLPGAKYGLYAAEDINHPDQKTGSVYKKDALVAQGTINSAGTLKFTDLYLGKYYVKEIAPGTGYLLDETVYPIELKYANQTTEVVYENVTAKEQVKKQAFQMLKINEDGNQTETNLVAGAGFKVYLISHLSGVKNGELKPSGDTFAATDFIGYDFSKEETAYYYEDRKKVSVPELITDKKGYLVSPELSYGTYVVYESTTPANYVTINPFIVNISEDSREPQEWRVFDDRPMQFYFKITKKDAQTQQTVLNNSASYKIFDVEADQYVEMMMRYPKHEKTDTFVTNDEGYLVTPEQLKSGTYRIEEVLAPEGYVQPGYEQILDQEGARIPLDQTTIGGTYQPDGTSAITIEVDSNTAHLVEEETGKYIVSLEQYNDEAVGSLKLTKQGEQLVKAEKKEEKLTTKMKNTFAKIVNKVSDFIFDEDALEVTTGYDFAYEMRSLAGVEFSIFAKETIYTPDGQRDEAGNQMVKYEKDELVSTLTTDGNGIAVLNNLPIGNYYLQEMKTDQGLVLDTEVKCFEIKYAGQEAAVDYNTMDITNERQHVNIRVVKKDAETKKSIEGGVFGLFAEEDILNRSGDIMVPKDELIELASTDGEGKLSFTEDLPHGCYYVLEVESKPGYLSNEEVYHLDASYTDPAQKTIELSCEVENQPTITEFTKVDITDGEEIEGASMQVFKDGEIIEEWVSGKEPHVIYTLEPGEYVLHEEVASKGYVVANDVTFGVLETGEVQKVVMKDERAMGRLLLQKKDAESNKPLKGVEFTLTEQGSDEVTETLVTDEEGYAQSELLAIGSYANGKFKENTVYVLKESKALDGYQTVDDEWEITFEYKDDQTPVIEVRKEITNKAVADDQIADAPKTGDNTIWFLPIVGIIVGASGIAYSIYCKRKKIKA